MAKSLQIEQYLNKHRLKFRYEPAWPLDQIDFEEAKRSNVARLGSRLDENRVLEYSKMMEDGDQFPALIIFQPPTDQKAELCDGLHRALAAMGVIIDGEPQQTIDVYVIEDCFDLGERESVIRASNALHGIGSTRDQKLEHAVQMYRNHPGLTLAVIAKEQYVGLSSLKNYLNSLEAEDRGLRLGLGEIMSSNVFTQSLKLELQKIHSNNTFIGTVTTIWKAKLRGKDAMEFAIACRKAPNEADAVELFDAKLREAIIIAQRPRPTVNKIPGGFINRAAALVRYARNKNLRLDFLPHTSWKGHVKMIDDLIRVLGDVRKELIRMIEIKEQTSINLTPAPRRRRPPPAPIQQRLWPDR